MKRLNQTEFFVEADNFSKHELWKQYKDELNWIEDPAGFAMAVGHVKSEGGEELPINVNFSFAKINGKMICFYYPISRGVDWGIIDGFIEKNYPVYYDKGKRFAKTDANNFHNCYHFVK